MRVQTIQARSIVGAAFAAAVLLSAAPARAQDYAGVFKASYVKQEAMPINGPQGHLILLSSSSGTHKSTGKLDYFDGGKITVNDVLDIVNGNGTQKGYITFESANGERTVGQLDGKVTTVMAPDGKTPLTTVEGTWHQVFGTNLYGTLKPEGIYKVKMISPTEYESEWKVTRFN